MPTIRGCGLTIDSATGQTGVMTVERPETGDSFATPASRRVSVGRAAGARRLGRRGQALTEFVTMVGLLMLVGTMLALLLFTFKEYGGRVLDLVGSEFP